MVGHLLLLSSALIQYMSVLDSILHAIGQLTLAVIVVVADEHDFIVVCIARVGVHLNCFCSCDEMRREDYANKITTEHAMKQQPAIMTNNNQPTTQPYRRRHHYQNVVGRVEVEVEGSLRMIGLLLSDMK